MMKTNLAGRVDAFRTLSTGGGDPPPARDIARRAPLLLQAGITGLDLRLGGYVRLEGDSGATLGQVRSPGLAEAEADADAGEVGLPATTAPTCGRG
jgi:hypothetical protein